MIQLRAWTSDEQHGEADLTFARLLIRYRLRKSVYGFHNPAGGGNNKLQTGICYSVGSQDERLLIHLPRYEVDGTEIIRQQIQQQEC